MIPITRDSHFVPRFYLKRWSVDGERTFVYDTLVPHQNYPEWRLRYISRIAVQQNIYTSVYGGTENDEIEKWLKIHVEEPAHEALKRLDARQQLSAGDIEALVRFAAVQEARTPQSFLDDMVRWRRDMPKIVEESLARSTTEFRRAIEEGRPLHTVERNSLEDRIPIIIQQTEGPQGHLTIEAGVRIGRELWLYKMRRMDSLVQLFLGHNWRILRPYPGTEWFTSDHPVLRLGYVDSSSFSFGGGWGQPGVEIIFPLGPSHMLYAKVGDPPGPTEQELDQGKTFEIQRLLSHRAFRSIYARSRVKRIAWDSFRPREVNAERYRQEREAWKQFHSIQMEELNPRG